VTAALQTAE